MTDVPIKDRVGDVFQAFKRFCYILFFFNILAAVSKSKALGGKDKHLGRAVAGL